jgi:putative heme-binding domain-containing protein
MPMNSEFAFNGKNRFNVVQLMKNIRFTIWSLLVGAMLLPYVPELSAQNSARKKRPQRRQPGRSQSTGMAINENQATPVDRIKAPDGFKVELLYSVPGPKQGSWVNLCVDNKNRIIVSDQYGGLYRFERPATGQSLKPEQVEKLPIDIRAVNGMLWAFDSLYLAVNDYQKQIDSGLYRATDSNGDGELDKLEKLKTLTASGDHGVHALLLSPDKKSLFLITGNNTEPAEVSSSRIPTRWGEDHLLPRMPDGRGHNRSRLAPGGIIYKISPDGKDWEIYSSGYRNIFDAGFNLDGELFTYDADMEYDFNTPWYRPTRICHVTSGSMWGWRNGTGKRPEWYPDTLPPVTNIGPGSPTGVTFGYGAKFPARYQKALFILDWSWGKVYAVHLEPKGASYTATRETFLTGSPLPVADAIIHPDDGAMYLTIGGRRVQSGLYRISYHGTESTDAIVHQPKVTPLAKLRHKLESHHKKMDPEAIEAAWPYLDHSDRFIRWAARTAVQHQAISKWAMKALSEPDHGKRVELLLSLVKSTGKDPANQKPGTPQSDRDLQKEILRSLAEVDWSQLNGEERITLVRTYEVCMVRFGKPSATESSKIIEQLDPHFPADSFELNWVLCETLAYLQAPSVAEKAIGLLNEAVTQQEQMEYARSLRLLKTGWTNELRESYFEWFLKATNYRGGASFAKFIEFIRNDAVASLTPKEKIALKELLDKQPEQKSPFEVMAAAMIGRTVKEWSLDELSSVAETELKNRDFQNGRKMFAAAGCFACHRFDNQGGMTGPDLTGAGGRYSPHDLLDQILNPSKEINEQFVPIILTKTDGETFEGVVVNLNGDRVSINTDLWDPFQQINIDRKLVKSIETSTTSPMPEGLLDMLKKDEILDMVAYILSAGDADNSLFK